jgi:hypothetical protein
MGFLSQQLQEGARYWRVIDEAPGQSDSGERVLPGRRAVFYAGPFQIGHGLWHMRVADAGYKLLQLEGR